MLTQEQLAFYRDNGYLIVEDLLEQAECDNIIRHAEEVIMGATPLSPGTGVWMEPAAQELGLVNDENRCEYLFKIGHQMHMHPGVFQKYATHPNVAAALKDLIGPDVKCVQSMYIDKPPHLGVGQPYHQDSWYLKTDPDSLLALWIACDDADVANGCLHVIPGSHLDPVHPHEMPLDPAQRILYIEVRTARSRKEIAVPLKKGDGVFFAGHVLHRSGNNTTSDRTRRAYVLHYGNAKSKWLNNPTAKNPFLSVCGKEYPGRL